MHKDAVYIYGIAKGCGEELTLKAVTRANEWHKGHKRDDGSEYFEHPLSVCRTVLNLNNQKKIVTDVVSAAALLHDTVEDGRVTYEILNQEFGNEVSSLVDLLTRRKGETEKEHIARVSQDPRAMLIKGADRFWNIGSMVKLVHVNHDIRRLEQYILNTEDYILPMLKDGRRVYLDYSDAYVLFRDIIKTIIKAAKCYIELFKEIQKLKTGKIRIKKYKRKNK